MFNDATERPRLLQESERRWLAAEGLAEVGRLITQSLDVAEVAERITESVLTLLGVSNSALFEARPDTEELVSLSLKAGRLELESVELLLRDCLGDALKAVAVRADAKGLALLSHGSGGNHGLDRASHA